MEALSSLIIEETHLRSLGATSVQTLQTIILAFPQRTCTSKATPSSDVSSYRKKAGYNIDGYFQLHQEQLVAFCVRRVLDQQGHAPQASSRYMGSSAIVATEPQARSASASALSQSAGAAIQPWVLDARASFHVI
ncbi:hypothetical protein VPH35_135965 [Triticum aestivum]